MVERKIPMVPYARMGGANGLKMSRAAFAVMIKFSDMLDDFNVIVDAVAMQAPLQEKGDLPPLISVIKEQPRSDMILRRWESASIMRQWMSTKKGQLSTRFEKVIHEEIIKKKKDEKVKKDEEEKKKAEEEEKRKAEEEEKKTEE